MVRANTAAWRNGYCEARRSFLLGNRAEIRRRLKRMGFYGLTRCARILDFGCGDGNLIDFLKQEGFTDVIGMEPDPLLLQRRLERRDVILSRGPELPFKSASFDAIVSMAVLHHLPDLETLRKQVSEFYRILKPGASLFYTEPADTLVRRMLTPVLMSPLASLTRFSRQKKLMVLAERNTLNMWLGLERRFVEEYLVPAGFKVRRKSRRGLKTLLHLTRGG